jgi:hypothetical protein
MVASSPVMSVRKMGSAFISARFTMTKATRQARDLRDEVEKLECDVMELFAMRHHARARRELAQAVESLRTKRDELTNDYSDIEI